MGGEWYVYKRLVLEFEVLPNTFNNQMERCSTFLKVNHELLPKKKSISRIVKHRSPTAKMQLPKSKMQLSHRRHFQLYIQFFQTDETI